MRYILLILIVISLILTSCSEKEQVETQVDSKDSTLSKTKIEEFLSKKGILFIKDFYEIGSISSDSRLYGKLDFNAIIIYKPDANTDSIKGLKVDIHTKEYLVYSSYDKSETVFLDLDELVELSAAIQYMYNLVDKWEAIKQEYTEVSYRTIGNFEIVLFPESTATDGKDKLNFAVKTGYSGTTCYFQNDIANSLKLLKEIFDKGIKKLNG